VDEMVKHRMKWLDSGIHVAELPSPAATVLVNNLNKVLIITD